MLLLVLTQFIPFDGAVLPFGIDAILLSGMGMFNTFASTFWFLEIVLEAFLFYLLFLIGMTVVKLVLGARTPIHD